VSGHVPPPTAADNYLTAAKRRVAGLWPASSLTATNARVAVELFTGQRTFEAHLSWAYRKLVVLSRRRTELCRLLVSPGPPQVPAGTPSENMRVSRIRPGTVRKYGHTVDQPGEHPASRAFPS
jgi:DNA-binding CsgD family transcriptional regulator